MKVAVTGKGGVGKTTFAAFLARCWRDLGHEVVAVDADPDANLAGTLGHRGEEIVPLVKLKSLIEERVGGGDGWGGFLRLNPRVHDIPEQFGVRVEGIRVLVMGTIERGRRGCACPENVLLREVLNHLMLSEREHVVVDMEAGVEHLGRGTAESVDEMLVIVEPGWASVQTAARVSRLARDLGIGKIHAVANGIDCDFFSPAHRFTSPYSAGPVFAFTGTMDYRPNVDAVRWFVSAVLPRVVAEKPDATLHVVGRSPAPAVLRLSAQHGHVVVTGPVDDVRPYFSRAAVFVVPIRMAGGVRLKILEALAMGLPVVSTTVGAEGTDLVDGNEILIADAAEPFAAAILRMT